MWDWHFSKQEHKIKQAYFFEPKFDTFELNADSSLNQRQS